MSGKRTRTERLVWSKATGRAINHGTFNGYNRHGCGCDDCWTAYSTSPKYLNQLAISRLASEKPRAS